MGNTENMEFVDIRPSSLGHIGESSEPSVAFSGVQLGSMNTEAVCSFTDMIGQKCGGDCIPLFDNSDENGCFSSKRQHHSMLICDNIDVDGCSSSKRSRVSSGYHNRCFAYSNIHSAPVGGSFVNVDRGISVAPLSENQECSRDATVMCRNADENESSSFKSCSSSKRLHDSMAICDNIDGNEGSSSKRQQVSIPTNDSTAGIDSSVVRIKDFHILNEDNRPSESCDLDNSTSNILIPLDSWTSGLVVYKLSLSGLMCLASPLSNTAYSLKQVNTAYPLPLDMAYRSSETKTKILCMTRSSMNELFTPYKEPEREFRSSRRHFKSLSLDELRSPDFNLLSDQEYSKEEEEEAMAETMEQYMSKTRTDYGSRVAKPKIDNKNQFELKCQFLKELRENTFSGSDNEDANEHIEKVLEILDLFHFPNIIVDQLMLRVFPISLIGAASRWLRNEPTGSIKT
ncbi:hypothetical protein Tco_0838324 [Tanacetum coccineum]|uniref:Uncharacterized protein n=1 Tax=Tanacetum coccineum TaxID=301880 RepID=A0ABQ5AQD7_9ASTR